MKKRVVQVISAMAHHGYLELEGGELLVRFIVQHCALPDTYQVQLLLCSFPPFFFFFPDLYGSSLLVAFSVLYVCVCVLVWWLFVVYMYTMYKMVTVKTNIIFCFPCD